MTQVLRHFSLDAKLGLSERQVQEVECILAPEEAHCPVQTPHLTPCMSLTLLNAHTSFVRMPVQARAIYGSNELSPDKGEASSIFILDLDV